MNNTTYTIISCSSEDTKKFGFTFAKRLPLGSVVLLTGDLGAGKTTFTRGVAEALKITDTITSPTFNIMKVYMKGEHPLIHIDAYRLAHQNHDIGLEEYIGYENGLTMIEWPEYIQELLPNNFYKVNIEHLHDDMRKITVSKESNL